jgi:hypothetical protein
VALPAADPVTCRSDPLLARWAAPTVVDVRFAAWWIGHRYCAFGSGVPIHRDSPQGERTCAPHGFLIKG